jgi:hypothetical protein
MLSACRSCPKIFAGYSLVGNLIVKGKLKVANNSW